MSGRRVRNLAITILAIVFLVVLGYFAQLRAYKLFYNRAPVVPGEWSKTEVIDIAKHRYITEDRTDFTPIVGFSYQNEETGEWNAATTSNYPNITTVEIKGDESDYFVTTRKKMLYKNLPWPWGRRLANWEEEWVLHDLDPEGDGPTYKMGDIPRDVQ